MTREKLKPAGLTDELKGNESILVLHNDEENTFEYVIESLMEVCGHDPIQAEQCTLIAHYNGKCPVKSGPREDLEVAFRGMTDRKLVVTIE